ncbi:MAG: hypothetical protein AAF497_13920 [Planctomycetota bacterium]
MQRRQWFRQSVAAITGMVLFVFRAGAQPPRRSATLQQQLEAGLRARRPQEFAYIATIIGLVKSGSVPEQLVRNVFNWARKKRVKYPFQHFARALPILAARQRIFVPKFVN